MMSDEYLRELPRLAQRRAESHKGDYGRVLVVGGSRGMSGAACLAGVAALRGGAGLVRVAVPESIQAAVAGFEPSYLTAGLVEDREGHISGDARSQIVELAGANDVIALGPGLGLSPGLVALVSWLYRNVKKPMVVDADALNALAQLPDALSQPAAARVVTPHPGEFGRLSGLDTKTVQSRRADVALDFAGRHGVVLVLKGHGTVVTDGQRLAINPTGNPGMATGGSGDVLTGLTAALLAQKLAPFLAAQLAVYVQGLAGDLAAEQFGQTALIASDLLDFLAPALRRIEGA
jgi:ADP-dependent NAD(P)H-hydrate dehydratase